jgi:RND family efflux transporter MFP subunit
MTAALGPDGARWPAARWLPLGLWLLLPALAPACRRTGEAADEPAASAPKRVRCAAVEAREVRDQVLLHGTVAPLPDRDALIAAQVAGRINRVLVREGDPVERGQPLARIEDAPLSDQAKQAAAQLAKARAETNLAKLTRARIQRVYERGIAARQELDDAEARLATAQAGESDVRAAAEIANRQLERATVRSPLSGVVLKVIRKPGELVDGTPATAILEVGDPSRLELVAAATAADLVRVRPGSAAAIDVTALPGARLAGTIAAVSPSVDRASGLGVVRVSLDLPSGGGAARPPVGVTGAARVDVGAPRRATMVPAAALRAALGDEAEVVLCGADRRLHVARVQRGVAEAGLVEVRGAADAGAASLAPGARVAVEPVLGLAEGDPFEAAP